MLFAKGFLDLQFSFAEKLAAVSGLPLERVLLEYTNLYVRLGCGRDSNPAHETWRAYLAGLRTAGDAREWTYHCYLKDAEAHTAPAVIATFGCFSYALPGSNTLRLHFRNPDAGGPSPLSAACRAQRRAELAALFAHAKSAAEDSTVVLGVSWLYNLEAYRRLFPPAYGESRQVILGRFGSMSLWGQFLNHQRQLESARALPFLSSLAEQSSVAGLESCFPLRVLTAQLPIREFYACYGLGPDVSGPPGRGQPRR
jgi:hypothetical protein